MKTGRSYPNFIKVGSFQETYNKGRIHTCTYYKILTRERYIGPAWPDKKYSLVGINDDEGNYVLPTHNSELRDSAGIIWKVRGSWEEKLILESGESELPSGYWLRKIDHGL